MKLFCPILVEFIMIIIFIANYSRTYCNFVVKLHNIIDVYVFLNHVGQIIININLFSQYYAAYKSNYEGKRKLTAGLQTYKAHSSYATI